MRFTPMTPTDKAFDSVDEIVADLGVSTRKASRCNVVTAQGKGRRPIRLWTEENDDSGDEPADNHDKFVNRQDDYRFSALSTGSGSSNTNTSPFASDALIGSSADSAFARSRIARRFELSTASGSVVGSRCACCRRYDKHLRSHDDCVAWHTRSHGYTPARSARLGHATQPAHTYAHSYTSPAVDINLISLPEYPADRSICERSPPRRPGLLFFTYAAVAACSLLLLTLVPRTLHTFGRQDRWGPLQQSLSTGAASNHVPPFQGMDAPQDVLNPFLEYHTVSGPNLEQTLVGEDSHRAALVESEEAQSWKEKGPDDASTALRGCTVPIPGESADGPVKIARMEEISKALLLLTGIEQADRTISITTMQSNSSGPSKTSGDGSHHFGWEEGFYYGERFYMYEQSPSLPLPHSPPQTYRKVNETESVEGSRPDPSAHLPGTSNSSSAHKVGHSRPRKINKLATVHISLVEAVNKTASSSSHGNSTIRGDISAQKGLKVLDYAVFPRGGQVVPPQTLRSAMDGEYLTSAEYETSRPVRGKFHLPFKIGRSSPI